MGSLRRRRRVLLVHLGATDSAYVVTAADAGLTLRVRVSAESAVGSRMATSRAVGPVGGVPLPDPDPGRSPSRSLSPSRIQTAGARPRTSGCIPGTTVRLTDARFLCDRPLSSYGTLPLKVDLDFTPGRRFGENGAIDLYTGCAGDGNPTTIDLIVDVEGDGVTYGPGVDAFKVRQGAGYSAGIQLTGHVDCGPRYAPDVHRTASSSRAAATSPSSTSLSGTTPAAARRARAPGRVLLLGRLRVRPHEHRRCARKLHRLQPFALQGMGSGDVVDARFRSGRTDGSDPLCAEFAGAPACDGSAPGVTMTGLTCQRWNVTTDRWE